MLISENIHYEDETNGVNEMEPEQSFKDSLDPSDTLSIKTEIRRSE